MAEPKGLTKASTVFRSSSVKLANSAADSELSHVTNICEESATIVPDLYWSSTWERSTPLQASWLKSLEAPTAATNHPADAEVTLAAASNPALEASTPAAVSSTA